MSDIDSNFQVGWDAIGLFIAYLVGLLILGVVANRAKKEDSMDDSFLAGRNLSLPVLFLTTFSSIFSGYTIVGVPADAFKLGFVAMYWITATSATQLGAVLLAPQIQVLAIKKRFVSPCDFIKYRYNFVYLSMIITFCQVVPTAIYALAQFKAIGSTVAGLTGNAIHPTISAAVLAAVMLTYEFSGGMRSVVWADSIQGVVILVSFVFVMVLLQTELGGLKGALDLIKTVAPKFVNVPSRPSQVGFFSFTLLFCCFPMYPHLMQRFYCAPNAKKLRITTSIMSFMPVYISTGSLVFGLIGLSRYGNTLADSKADQVFGLVAKLLMQSGGIGYWTVTFLLCAAVAALMSTTDSLLMALSSQVVSDLVKPYCLKKVDDGAPREEKQAQEKKLITIAHGISLLVVIIDVLMTLVTVDLSYLVALQSNILAQCAPIFWLGVSWKRLDGQTAFTGVVVGLIITVALVFSDNGKVGGMHAGIVAALCNLFVCVVGTFVKEHMATPEAKDANEKRISEIMLAQDITNHKYPLDYKWYPALLFLSIFMCLPWYRTPGEVDGTVGGFTTWAFVAFLFTIVMCCLVAYGAMNLWPELPAKDLEEAKDLSADRMVHSGMVTPHTGKTPRPGSKDPAAQQAAVAEANKAEREHRAIDEEMAKESMRVELPAIASA